METKQLEKIGLTKNESILYVSLLRLGSSDAQSIVNESELHRSRVYDGLESLQRKGLVSYVIKDYKKYFQAVKPEKLLDYVEEQKENVRQVIPQLKKIEGLKREEIKASVFKGKEGLKTIHSEILKEGKDIRVLGAKGLIFSELKYYIPNFEREMNRKNMKWRCLWDKKGISKKLSDKSKFEGKDLPKGYDSKTAIDIFGDKVAIVLWKENYPTGFMIDNKDVADSFRKWFEMIYEKI